VPDRHAPGPAACRVLLVLAHAEGGIGRHVRFLAQRLPELGLVVSVCAPADTLRRLELACGGGASGVVAVSAPIGQHGAHQVRQVRAVLRSLAAEVDVVHAHGLRAGADCAAVLTDLPLVVTWHNAAAGGWTRRLAHGALARFVARRSAVTLAASPDLAAAAQRAGAANVCDGFVVAPTLPEPRRTPSEVREALGVGQRPLVLAVGRLARQKRFDVLIAAAGGWAPRPRDAVPPPDQPVVVIAGDGPDRAELARLIAAASAPVRLVGTRDDVAELLAAADVVALPSQWEARALVAQEALRSGVPLVTTAVGGLPQLVGDAAVMVEVGDPLALRRALERVLADRSLQARLSELGRAQAASWPDEAACLAQLAEIYLDLYSKSSR
jgi:glycosyltransferase involved in cell wall biosynthesis